MRACVVLAQLGGARSPTPHHCSHPWSAARCAPRLLIERHMLYGGVSSPLTLFTRTQMFRDEGSSMNAGFGLCAVDLGMIQE